MKNILNELFQILRIVVRHETLLFQICQGHLFFVEYEIAGKILKINIKLIIYCCTQSKKNEEHFLTWKMILNTSNVS